MFKKISLFLLSVGVGMGAFAAHGLKDFISPERMEVFKTSCFYLISMSLVLLNISQDLNISKKLKVTFLIGIIIFSLSLFLLVLLDLPKLGAITPIGGSLLIISLFLMGLNYKNGSNKESS